MPGMGSTTVLRHVRDALGGAFVGVRQFLGELMRSNPLALEETLLRVLEDAIREHDVVIVDDLHLINDVTNSGDYPRTCLLDAALTAIPDDAAIRGVRLVFGLRKHREPAS